MWHSAPALNFYLKKRQLSSPIVLLIKRSDHSHYFHFNNYGRFFGNSLAEAILIAFSFHCATVRSLVRASRLIRCVLLQLYQIFRIPFDPTPPKRLLMILSRPRPRPRVFFNTCYAYNYMRNVENAYLAWFRFGLRSFLFLFLRRLISFGNRIMAYKFDIEVLCHFISKKGKVLHICVVWWAV